MNNPPAFPRPVSHDCAPHDGITQGDRIIYEQAQDGMTLRDYFAAAAMQGYWANKNDGAKTDQERAEWSYMLADAMLEAREKK